MPLKTLLALFLCINSAHASTIYSEVISGCTVKLEGKNSSTLISIRMRHPDNKFCTLSKLQTQRFLTNAFGKLDKEVTYQQLYLGRLIHYKWISKHVADYAESDPVWRNDAEKQRGGNSAYVYLKRLLQQKAIQGVISGAIKKSGYQATEPRVEKVLISKAGARGVPGWVDSDVKVPFDAMCYFSLQTARTPSAAYSLK